MPFPYVLLTALYCAAIFLSSADPYPKIPDVYIPMKDKLLHAILFGGLCACVSLGMRRSHNRYSPWEQFLVPIVFAAAYGLSDEIHQIYVPNRIFDLADVAADALGAIAANIVLCAGAWRLHTRSA